MKKLQTFFKNKRNVAIVSVCAVIVIALGFVIFGNSSKRMQAKLEKELQALGKDFYENFYYDLVVKDNGLEAISKFKTVGVKINLDNISRYKEENADIVKDFINPKTKEECDKLTTRAVIYPKAPYGKTDNEVKVELVCGFDEEESK